MRHSCSPIHTDESRMSDTATDPDVQPYLNEYRGLAPFLRMSIGGGDLAALAQKLLAQAQQDLEDASLWMNLATVLFCLNDDRMGSMVQNQALALQPRHHRAATRQPTRFRLLMLMVPGNISANTPIDCLLEDSPVEIIYQYLIPGAPLPNDIPDHDALMIGMSDSPENRPLLAELEPILAQWPRPVINRPEQIPATERSLASHLLSDAPGVVMPPTLQASRNALGEITDGTVLLTDVLPEGIAALDFPLILRPMGSHGGHGLERIDTPEAIGPYLEANPEAEFFLSPFVDYQNRDGFYRKLRIVLIDGQPFVAHMAISTHWMIHYLNAGMYEDAAKRDEEAAFMAGFDDFAKRHADALAAIHQRTGLDYVCIDCAETMDGRLLIFEVDHVMVVHAMDPVDLFPYKPAQIARIQQAFEQYLVQRATEMDIELPQ